MVQPIKVSVAIATYNGGMYLAEQLRSILNQTRGPDEIVVSDDGSTDDTLDIARKLLEGGPISWRIVKNRYGRGISTNFSTALEETTGEIVFLCDQDDIWLPRKVEITLSQFVGSDSELIVHDAFLWTEGEKENSRKFSDELRRRGVDPDGLAFGCMTAVRRTLLDAVLPITSRKIGQDGIILYLSRQRGTYKRVDMPLIYYRRHGANITHDFFPEAKKWKRLLRVPQTMFDYRWLDRRRHLLEGAADRVRRKGDAIVPPAAAPQLMFDLEVAQLRHDAVLRGRRLSPLLRWRDYRRLSVPGRAWAKDAVSALLRLHRRSEKARGLAKRRLGQDEYEHEA